MTDPDPAHRLDQTVIARGRFEGKCTCGLFVFIGPMHMVAHMHQLHLLFPDTVFTGAGS